MKVFVGTSGYFYPAWKGSFYPQKLAVEEQGYYSEGFNTVKFNSTFKGMPRASELETWAAVPAGFRFR